MTFTEFIGFIVTMVFLTILFFKRLFEKRKQSLEPESYDREEEDQRKNLKEFLRSLEGDMQEDEKRAHTQQPKRVQPPPPPVVQKKEIRPPRQPASERFQFKGKLEGRRPESAIEKRGFKTNIEDRFYESFDERLLSSDFRSSSTTAYELVHLSKTPRIKNLVRGLPSLKSMIVLKEIMGPPKGMQFLE